MPLNQNQAIRNLARQVTRGYIKLTSPEKFSGFPATLNGGFSYHNGKLLIDGGASSSTYTSTNYDGGTA